MRPLAFGHFGSLDVALQSSRYTRIRRLRRSTSISACSLWFCAMRSAQTLPRPHEAGNYERATAGCRDHRQDDFYRTHVFLRPSTRVL